MSILEQLGLEIKTDLDGLLIIDMLSNSALNYSNVILMDRQMPNLEGYQDKKMISPPSQAAMTVNTT
ncbi:MAG: hypothetical protein HRU38_10160 [Saccharospirillaceae bacterium]|nr:hypothetical protein [Pseudomonadales bacterium]NRB79016.1 hypothetical protein [Saccharospirillaceae bacterium]